ncbi:MAG: hypothetical protein K2O89_06170 [Clostridia bacterium]|nr:hypothetical protein [Clostridia bacterium]
MPMYTGHCINEEIPWKVRKINVTDVNCCEKWESNEELKKERKENIKNIIKNMRSKLIQIEKILADDL